jgi:purine-binding chemotaxis protein CheW
MNIAELRKKAVKKSTANTAVQASSTPSAPTLPFQERAPEENALLRETMPESTPPPTPPPTPPTSPTLVPVLAPTSSVMAEPLDHRLDDLFAVIAQHYADSETQLLAGAWGQEKTTVEEYRQMLSFSLGNEEYALDIHDIREIIKPREITDIPRVPEFILGIISLRGNVIPIFDLKRRFNLGTSILSPTSRIIVCQRDNKSAGLLVDSISQVIRIPQSSIEPPPPVLSGLERELLEGVGRHQERMLILLNMPCVLNSDLI